MTLNHQPIHLRKEMVPILQPTKIFLFDFLSILDLGLGLADDWFADKFDELVFGDIDELTRDDEKVNGHHHGENEFDPTSLDPDFGKSNVLNPFAHWGDTGVNINYIPDDFSVMADSDPV